MPSFPLPPALANIHDEALAYASAVQCDVATAGGCKTLSCEALNILMFNAVLTHKSVRTLCEEGWTPLTSLLNRTLLDIFGNCVAVCNVLGNSEYMGFKYISHFYRRWLVQPGITAPEQAEATNALKVLTQQLSPTDQQKAQALCAEPVPSTYWFQPEYPNTKAILDLAQHPIYQLFKMYSGPTHGGFDLKLLLNDDPRSESIEPRDHPRNVPKAIVASSRLLTEIVHIRDNWDNHDRHEARYQQFLADLAKLRN